MDAAPDVPWPPDAVEVGFVADAFGIKGWIRVQPHAADPQALFSTTLWFLKLPLDARHGPAGGRVVVLPPLLKIAQAKEHGGGVVAQVRGVDDRAGAEALKGARVFVSRQSFPSAGADEFYWVDLIGLSVVNRQGEALGTVAGLLDTGPQSVLRVVPQPAGGDAADGAKPPLPDERLIPFVAAYVDSVDLAARRIVVDWGTDY